MILKLQDGLKKTIGLWLMLKKNYSWNVKILGLLFQHTEIDLLSSSDKRVSWLSAGDENPFPDGEILLTNITNKMNERHDKPVQMEV